MKRAPVMQMYSSLLIPYSSDSQISPQEAAYRSAGLVKTAGTIALLPPSREELVYAFSKPPRPKTRMSSGAVALCKHFQRRPWSRYSSMGGQRHQMPMIDEAKGLQDDIQEHSHVHDRANDDRTEHGSIFQHDGDEKRCGSKENFEMPSERNLKPEDTAWQHPYWPVPVGSNENKTRIASELLERVLTDSRQPGAWRNVMLLHRGVAVYEIRDLQGYGMRWTLDVEEGPESQTDQAFRGSDADCAGAGDDEARAQKTESNTSHPNAWKIVRTTFRGFLEPIEGLDHELPSSQVDSASK